jgi:fructose-bisphosphate aldolase/6-deoxy-5-ketofructose 1-phosphate synthase
MKPFIIPHDIPEAMHQVYKENYQALTRNTGSLLLMAGDQKIEHLLDDVYGNNIPEEVIDPEHLFRIASAGHIGCFAAPAGLIARYARAADGISYMVNRRYTGIKEQ